MHIDILYYYSSNFILIYKVPHVLEIRIPWHSVFRRLPIPFRINLWINFFHGSYFTSTRLGIVRCWHHSTNLGNLFETIFGSFRMINRGLRRRFYLGCIAFKESSLLMRCLTSSFVVVRSLGGAWAETWLRTYHKVYGEFFFLRWLKSAMVIDYSLIYDLRLESLGWKHLI